MLCEAFGEHSLSHTVVYEWHSCFKAGRVSVQDDKCSGQPSTSKTTQNVQKIRELIHEDYCQTIHELADTTGISYSLPGDFNRKFEHASHYPKVCPLTLDKRSKAAACRSVS
jgi:transposase